MKGTETLKIGENRKDSARRFEAESGTLRSTECLLSSGEDMPTRVSPTATDGLIIGVGEKVAEVYWGPLVNGAIENWFAYVVALIFLLFRPQGLFGEKIIERV